VILNIINKHIVPLLGYLAAYLAPIGGFVITIVALLFSNLVIGWLLERNKKIKSNQSWRKFGIVTGIYIWIVLIMRTADHVFLNDTPVLSKFIAGYMCWDQLKILIKNIDSYSGGHLWQQIEETLKKIKL